MSSAPPTRHVPPKVVAGVALIIVGLLILLNSFVQGDIGAIILLAVGLVFLAWGILARHAGPMIPGGILSGISVGLLLVQQHTFVETESAGIITLCLGIGFLVILPLSMFFSSHPQRWSLIPGGILTVVGALLLFGGVGLDILTWVSKLWPLVLVGFGGYFLWEVYRRRSQ
jgi:hypothetical protein